MIPTIKRGYNCVVIQMFFCSLIFSFYVLLNGFSFSPLKFTMAMGIAIYCLFLVIYFRPIINSSLSKQNLSQAGKIYFFVNSLISISVTIVFEFWLSESEFDRAIALSISLYWLVYFFNLIPGGIKYKIVMYIFTITVVIGIAKPKVTLGLVAYFANATGHTFQLYIIWSKFHEENIILNKIENEKSINDFLQNQNPHPIFTLDKNFNITKMNKRAVKLFQEEKKDSFKEYGKELFLKSQINLFDYLEANNNFDNLECFRISNKKKEKILVSSSKFN